MKALTENVLELTVHLLFVQKEYEFLRERFFGLFVENAVKATIQILHDERIFDECVSADEFLKDYLTFIEGRRGRAIFQPLRNHPKKV